MIGRQIRPAILLTVTLMLITGIAYPGIVTGLAIPVSVGDRLMLVYSATAAGVSLINSVPGTMSGGVSFE